MSIELTINVQGQTQLAALLKDAAAARITLPTVEQTLDSWSELARQFWLDTALAARRAGSIPAWWIDNYLGTAGANIQTHTPGPLRRAVFYTDEGARYRYGRVVEEGRGAYDQKQALQTSPRARRYRGGSLAGLRYIVIPFPVPRNSEDLPPPDVVLQKIGERVETRSGARVIRNIYSTGGGKRPGTLHAKGQSLAEFHQVDRTGKVHRSQVNLVVMHERSRGWIQRPIRGIPFSRRTEDTVKNDRLRLNFDGRPLAYEESLNRAAAIDIVRLLHRLAGEQA